jgi:competence CoiA-like predicted nuclease
MLSELSTKMLREEEKTLKRRGLKPLWLLQRKGSTMTTVTSTLPKGLKENFNNWSMTSLNKWNKTNRMRDNNRPRKDQSF